MDTRVNKMPKTKNTKRVSSLRSKYKQTGGSLAMAWVLDERRRKSRKAKKPRIMDGPLPSLDQTDKSMGRGENCVGAAGVMADLDMKKKHSAHS